MHIKQQIVYLTLGKKHELHQHALILNPENAPGSFVPVYILHKCDYRSELSLV